MVGCAALQAGHCRSPNSTIVTGASLGPRVGAGDSLLQSLLRRIEGLRAERNNLADEGVLAVGRDVEACQLLALLAGENDGDFRQSLGSRRA